MKLLLEHLGRPLEDKWPFPVSNSLDFYHNIDSNMEDSLCRTGFFQSTSEGESQNDNWYVGVAVRQCCGS